MWRAPTRLILARDEEEPMRRRPTAIIAISALAVLQLAGCAGDATEHTDAAATAAATATTASATTRPSPDTTAAIPDTTVMAANTTGGLHLDATYLKSWEPAPLGSAGRAHQYVGDIDGFGADPSFDPYGAAGLVST